MFTAARTGSVSARRHCVVEGAAPRGCRLLRGIGQEAVSSSDRRGDDSRGLRRGRATEELKTSRRHPGAAALQDSVALAARAEPRRDDGVRAG